MSFLGGAECSTAGNPLSQFTKHVQDDKSLQRDRLVGSGPAGLQEGFRSQRGGSGQEEMMQNFLQQNGQLPQDSPQPFAMEQLRRDLDGYRVNSSRPGSSPWATEFDQTEQAQMEAAFHTPDIGALLPPGVSPVQFQRYELRHERMKREASVGDGNTSVQMQPGMNGFQRTRNLGYGMSSFAALHRPTNWQRGPSEEMIAGKGKGKGRMVELDEKDWENQFAEIEAAQYQDIDAEANAAMEEELHQLDRSVLSETNEFGDFESIWRGIQAETAASRSFVNEDIGMHDGDLSSSLLDGWEGFDSHYAFDQDPDLGKYTFEEENPFTTTGNPFEEGVKIMREGGNLSLAALAFESAVQQDPQHVDAWTQLGNAQAQNEKETAAIRALEQALKIDPSNLPALMGLAISYTNESYDSTAYRTLERWLANKYPQVISLDDLSPDNDIGFTERNLLHDRVTNLFIRAAQLSPDGDHMDPDVQVGLGVLFYGAEDFSKAVDCFEAALASTEEGMSNEPQQAHLLWNRLGATLANSGRSEEAIAAYEKALTLNPNFVRARYNLGVSCINIGVYEQAAQHLLGALSMHRVVEREGMERVQEVIGGNPALTAGEVERMVGMNQSSNLLETLRRVFSNMGRRDLVDKVENGMDVEQFRGEFDF